MNPDCPLEEKLFALSPSTPFVLSLSKERTVLRRALSKGHSWFDKLTTNGLFCHFRLMDNLG
jgi:hypothetical protein